MYYSSHCPDGEIGRHASFRCWSSQGGGGSSPLLGTKFSKPSQALGFFVCAPHNQPNVRAVAPGVRGNFPPSGPSKRILIKSGYPYAKPTRATQPCHHRRPGAARAGAAGDQQYAAGRGDSAARCRPRYIQPRTHRPGQCPAPAGGIFPAGAGHPAAHPAHARGAR